MYTVGAGTAHKNKKNKKYFTPIHALKTMPAHVVLEIPTPPNPNPNPNSDPDPDSGPRLSLNLHLTRTLTKPEPLPYPDRSLNPKA